MAEHDIAPDRRAAGITVVAAAACWVVAVIEMRGMDMGVSTGLGSFGFFIGVWAAMMAAMMLPGAVPAVTGYARRHRNAGALALFLTTYLGVWAVFGIAAYAAYRPHSSTTAGVLAIGAGAYELTPLKRRSRRRCQQAANSGVHLGIFCVGSSLGLMVLLLAVGAMSVWWMAAIAVLALVQKLTRPHSHIDVALALAIAAFGALILISPTTVPGLVPAM